MKNREKYADKILEIACEGDSIAMNKATNELIDCRSLECPNCFFNFSNKDNDNSFGFSCAENIKTWCEQEYEEYETDWSKVPVDTPVLAKLSETDNETFKRHFCKYKNDFIYCWDEGKTSFSVDDIYDYSFWECVELANEEDKIKYRKI